MNYRIAYTMTLIYGFTGTTISATFIPKDASYYDPIRYYYTAASTTKPNDVACAVEYAHTLAHAQRDAEAIEAYEHILRQDPTMTDVLNNFGFVLARSGRVAEAIEMYKRSLRENDCALTHLNLGIAYLTHGDLEHGFREYEWRWAAFDEPHDTFPRPTWDGCDLKGKRIYVHAEQGFGDTFQFIRYLFLLKKMGAFVIFNTQAPLKALLRLCPYIDILITSEDPFPDFDYYSPLLSLPTLFNTRLDTVPAPIPYLYAHEQLVQEWKQRLANDKNYKIGICWQGNAAYQNSLVQNIVAAKSCKLEYFSILAAIPGVTLYSLQKIHGMDQITDGAENSFVHIFDATFDERDGRFMDTAAVIKNLDLVITIDTSIGHLAAALGVPTWILLPEPADWRWMRSQTDTPWYPNVRLFRQQTPGDWTTVMHTVADALKKRDVDLPVLNVQFLLLCFRSQSSASSLWHFLISYYKITKSRYKCQIQH